MDLTDKIEHVSKSAGLSEIGTRAAKALARDPHGIEREAAPSMLASLLDISLKDASDAVIELLTKKVVHEKTKTTRLEVDLSLLGLTSEQIDTLRIHQTVFENHGAPHSNKAMHSLSKLFEKTDGTLYIGLEVTPPSIFKDLKARAKARKQTVFLMPRKRDVSTQRQLHYSEVLKEWKDFFRTEEVAVRKNTELRITEIPFKDLYTSALSSDVARFDVHFLDSSSTRKGDIIEVKNKTSLYESISARYKEALARSCPLWSIWWWKAMAIWFKCLLLPLFLIVLGLILASYTNPYAAVVSTIVLGTLVNIITKHLGILNWRPEALFEN
ncbi:hypothetical protein FCL47_09955 [Desulfopila sp. IMCC35006]|uniref:hypothetical protein n=1 Tax=Desulfopila sp. IMCC35006 TaxID=2569542 RepID=UPI0010AC013E|nr:hypothetical protein [Desulfopila sp. IMCC35006]TKB26065.1 hypothetical protein FCL47_09955 [Desulfopila sp. IMCC35006]